MTPNPFSSLYIPRAPAIITTPTKSENIQPPAMTPIQSDNLLQPASQTTTPAPIKPEITVDKTEPKTVVPWPNSKYLIRCATTGKVVTLRDGKVTLGTMGDRNLIRWELLQANGWLAFRDPVSHLCLSYFGDQLQCSTALNSVYRFTMRHAPEGGYYLCVSRNGKLDPVGTKEVSNDNTSLKIVSWETVTTRWEFIKVD